MDLKSINTTETAARVLLARIAAAKDELKTQGLNGMAADSYTCGTAISGALRRASMELTRALAHLRK